MSDPSRTDFQFVTVKKEIISGLYGPGNEDTPCIEPLLQQSTEHLHMEKQKSRVADKFEAAESEEDDGIHYLSGKPFFDVILAKSHVNPTYHLQLPVKIVRELPRAMVPVVLRCNRKNWNLSYVGNARTPRFDPRWKNFVTDNDLTMGDACVFELMESSCKSIKFKVHILRCSLPAELLAAEVHRGTENNPILVG